MKKEKRKRKNKLKGSRGVATLEVLIAFVVVTLAMSAVTLIAFGNHTLALDARQTQRALYHAERGMETAFATSTKDFSSLASAVLALLPGVDDDIYTNDIELDVLPISDCAKIVESKLDWSPSSFRSRSQTLTSVFTSTTTSAALGNDCDTVAPSGSWEAPDNFPNAEAIHPGSRATDVDVVKVSGDTFALLTTSGSGDQFWFIDVTNSANPQLKAQFNSGDDLYAVDAFASGTDVYAFVASASSTAQLQVMKIDLLGYPGISPVVSRISTEQLPGVGNSYPQGRSVYYYDGKIYVGTHETAGPELHVFDVSIPASPAHLGDEELFTNVHDIYVIGEYAYLATSDNDSELCVVDVSDPGNMEDCEDVVGMQYDAGGNFDGTAIEVKGGRAYLGRERAAGSHDFYILDITDLSNVSSLGSIDLNLNSNKEVAGVAVRGSLAFVSTTDTTPANGGGPFIVYDISDPNEITKISTCAFNYSEQATGLDFVDNLAYISNESQNALQIIYPGLSCGS